MAKEGESYLDELLDTVAPDWGETSISPEDMLEDFDESLAEDVSLEDALSILDDLPDSEEAYFDGEDEWDGVNDLLGISSDFGDGELEDLGDMPDMEETPVENTPKKEMPKEEVTTAKEQAPTEDKAVTLEKDTASDDVMPEEDMAETDIPVLGDVPSSDEGADSSKKQKSSSESVDVDDIFQDALSAVGYSGEEEDDVDFLSVGEVDGFMDTEEEGITSVPVADPMEAKEASPKKKKKEKKKGPGFFARIFGNVITDQTAEEEERERQEEEAAIAKKAAEKEEKKKQAEVAKEEKAQHAQEEKERKKQLKAEQAAKKAEEKEAKKEEKKRLKEERKAEAAAQQEVVGKINPIGATIVVIFFATIGIFTLIGAMMFTRDKSLVNAENYFASGDYLEAYHAINTIDVDEENDVLYRQIYICSQMQKEVNSYTNYSAIGMRLEALDSLVKGIRYYDLNKVNADALGISGQFDRLESQLSTSLSTDFGISPDDARELLKINDQSEYTRQLEEIVSRTSEA